MRFTIATLVSKVFLLLTGLGLLCAGLFAFQLGIDNDPGWGKGRTIITLLGVALLASAGVLQYGEHLWNRPLLLMLRQGLNCASSAIDGSAVMRAWRKAGRAFQALPLVRYLECHPRLGAFISGGLGVLLVLLLYVWYLTAGTWTHLTPYSAYFDRLAAAFLNGQVALLEPPSPQLLAMENPYDWRQREVIPHLWDATFYQGKYYLYWGPAPALVAAGAKFFMQGTVEDQHLVLFFCAGLVILVALILALLREKLYPDAPAWTLLPLVLLSGLSIPVFWLVNSPGVYQAAIAGGQFFLLLGLYAALRVLLRTGDPAKWLLAAGLAWGAAINCRLNLAAAVGFFCLVIAWVLFREAQGTGRWVRQIAWLALPLALWIAGMGWYNFARFGNPLETGHRYQLTGPALPADYSAVTSPNYILPNLYNYVFRPLRTNTEEFPFVFAPYIKESMWPFFMRLPENYYYSEPVAGLLLIAPGIWLAFLPVLGLIRRVWRWLKEEKNQPVNAYIEQPTWLWVMLFGGTLCLLAPLLVFISSSMRYLADVMPALGLLAGLGLWWGLRFFRSSGLFRGGLAFVALALIVVSVGMSLLANFTNGDKRFEANNPALYYGIADFFQPRN